jgi:outer membrane protein OmpA-like peptidoglycan-associated protein
MTRTTTRTRAGLGAACLVLGFNAAACGGITRFEDTTPIVLKSPVPPPEPPPEPPARVEVKKDRIEIKEKIQFAYNAAEILPASDGLLGEVAAALKEHAEIKKLTINGHTDSDGEVAYNQELSQRRATAVLNWLKGHGVAAARLHAKGFGESQPIADNATPEGKEKNRRVEFLITEQEGVK